MNALQMNYGFLDLFVHRNLDPHTIITRQDMKWDNIIQSSNKTVSYPSSFKFMMLKSTSEFDIPQGFNATPNLFEMYEIIIKATNTIQGFH